MTDTDFSFALRQIEGRQRTKEKLPFLQELPDWLFPKRLSTEQCSSEVTARYKRRVIEGFKSQVSGFRSQDDSSFKSQVSGFRSQVSGVMVDLTGGMGIDTLFLSGEFDEVHYVERDEELCRLAEHNFRLGGLSSLRGLRSLSSLGSLSSLRGLSSLGSCIEVHCEEAEEFLRRMEKADLIYIDPARRSVSGKKVFRTEDCEPNVVELLPLLREKCSTLLIKLSPMLDLNAAMNSLPETREVHVVAAKGEVKEVLIYLNFAQTAQETGVKIHCVNLETEDEELVFSMEEEREAECEYATETEEYVYEPNAAIMKAGAFKTVAARYGVKKAGVNTHLYTLDRRIESWPGRVWRIVKSEESKAKSEELKGRKMNILARNYPMSADEIKKKYKIRDGGEEWLIATRVADRNIMYMAERVQ